MTKQLAFFFENKCARKQEKQQKKKNYGISETHKQLECLLIISKKFIPFSYVYAYLILLLFYQLNWQSPANTFFVAFVYTWPWNNFPIHANTQNDNKKLTTKTSPKRNYAIVLILWYIHRVIFFRFLRRGICRQCFTEFFLRIEISSKIVINFTIASNELKMIAEKECFFFFLLFLLFIDKTVHKYGKHQFVGNYEWLNIHTHIKLWIS